MTFQKGQTYTRKEIYGIGNDGSLTQNQQSGYSKLNNTYYLLCNMGADTVGCNYDNSFISDNQFSWYTKPVSHNSQQTQELILNRYKTLLFFRNNKKDPFDYWGEVVCVNYNKEAVTHNNDGRPTTQIIWERIDNLSSDDCSFKDESEERKYKASKCIERGDAARKFKDSANNVCSICYALGEELPNNSFQMKDGKYYLEVHHITPLSKNGQDVCTNLTMVCPKHHRQIHFGQSTLSINDKTKFVYKIDGRDVKIIK